jgi:hypothetical protein
MFGFNHVSMPDRVSVWHRNDLVALYQELDQVQASCPVMVPRDVIAYVW